MIPSTRNRDQAGNVLTFQDCLVQVLSDPQRRAIYDQHGEEEEPKGVPRDAEDIFTEIFGSSNPFGFESMNRTKSTRFQADGSGSAAPAARPWKAPAVERKLACSLEELYHGRAAGAAEPLPSA